MRKAILIKFAVKWGVSESALIAILKIYSMTGTYVGTCRIAKSLGTQIEPRRVRYLCRKMRLDLRVEYKKLGRPKNYRDLLRNFA